MSGDTEDCENVRTIAEIRSQLEEAQSKLACALTALRDFPSFKRTKEQADYIDSVFDKLNPPARPVSLSPLQEKEQLPTRCQCGADCDRSFIRKFRIHNTG